MTETEWLTNADPVALVNYLIYEQKYTPGPVSEPGIIPYRRAPLVSNRKLRLIACACVRQVWSWLTDSRSRNAVEVAESFADGGATVAELENAAYHAHQAYRHGVPHYEPDMVTCPNGKAVNAFAAAVNAAWDNIVREAPVAARHCREAGANPADQADILREIVGNPFRLVSLPSRPSGLCAACGAGRHDHCGAQVSAAGIRCGCQICWGRPAHPWLTPTVLSLATAAYEHRTPQGHLDPARLTVLADALEEAGCSQQCESCGGSRLGHDNNGMCGDCEGSGWVEHDIITHLRSPGPHVRGCWSLDLVLGKK